MRVKELLRYTLTNDDGDRLHLFLGQEDGHATMSKDRGFRWMFMGQKIPMPVRSGTWFNGFPVQNMLSWLNENGWELHSVLSLTTNKLTVMCKAAKNAPKLSKGNKIPASTGSQSADMLNYEAFCDVIKELCNGGRKIDAIRLYRYAHGGCLKDANEAVNEIRECLTSHAKL